MGVWMSRQSSGKRLSGTKSKLFILNYVIDKSEFDFGQDMPSSVSRERFFDSKTPTFPLDKFLATPLNNIHNTWQPHNTYQDTAKFIVKFNTSWIQLAFVLHKFVGSKQLFKAWTPNIWSIMWILIPKNN